MRFIKENIEELIFDYHEGNLSDADRAEVLNLIHQHPEYESDFILMAQTYAHVDEKLPDYGLTSSLLKTPALPWYAQTRVQLSLFAVCIVGVSLFILWPRTQNTSEASNSAGVAEQPSFPEKQQVNTHATFITDSIHAGAVSEPVIVNAATSNDTGSLYVAKEDVQPLSSEKVEFMQNEHEQIQPAIEKLQAKGADTLTRTDMVPTQEKPVVKVKKSKKRTKIDMKPSTEFIPVNTDF